MKTTHQRTTSKKQAKASPFFAPSIQRNPKKRGDDPFKLRTPKLSGSLFKPKKLGFDLPKLELDPSIEAKMKVFRLLHGQLSIENLMLNTSFITKPVSVPPLDLLSMPPDYFANQARNPNLNLPPVTSSSSALKPSATSGMPMGRGPTPPRAATMGDLVKAVLAIPVVKEKVEEVKSDALEVVENQWDGISKGGQITIISSAIALAGGGVTYLGSMTPEQRRPILAPISGQKIPIPKTPLSIQYQQSDRGEQVMIFLDVGKLLPRHLGFKK